ncbi:heparan-alpha-glucosaminide N-acetyltransferase domain-containing protein [uncultured Cellulomonas sp.]|uniref:heparan-alpha-glucosaminide N-acetyltransferase domain-containing protein n=1 Tax=uncultured Cellulomonas sp. TaxID=189682 RepID=UPI0028E6CA1B|nr:heparan-alpha-glucosaminide N-acetyltransferase domain-containing protein [uncultured Cellulomonas sp.]
MRRIVGIDVARGLAVLGMMTAHVGPDDDGPIPPGGFAQLADGRPAALFVVLAGLSLALLSGSAVPVTGTRLVQARLRILVRAVLLFALGALLVMLGTPVVVILPTYGLLFALGCVALRWSRAALLTTAGVVAVVGPPVGQGLAAALEDVRPTILTEITVGHYYPAIVWMAYLLVGLAIGRTDLRSPRWRAVGALAGVGLVVLGHGGSWVALHVLGWPEALATAEPHSSTTFEVVGNVGVALLVIAVCLAVADRWPRVLAPLAAVGALALSAYSVHIVVIALLGRTVVYDATVGVWLAFVLTTTVLCWLWAVAAGRGPLEWVLHRVSTRAADTSPDELPVPTSP